MSAIARFEHPYLAGHGFVCFAHRGGAAEAPENSRRAFERAQALGYRFIEIDVQATADGTLIVFHDDTLDATTDGEGAISALPLSEVRQARIHGTEPILTLEEALAAHCAQVPIAEFGITIVTRRFVRYCNRRGVAVHVWTVNDEAEMRRLIRLGVNGLMTDRPTLLKKVAMEEGVWVD